MQCGHALSQPEVHTHSDLKCNAIIHNRLLSRYPGKPFLWWFGHFNGLWNTSYNRIIILVTDWNFIAFSRNGNLGLEEQKTPPVVPWSVSQLWEAALWWSWTIMSTAAFWPCIFSAPYMASQILCSSVYIVHLCMGFTQLLLSSVCAVLYQNLNLSHWSKVVSWTRALNTQNSGSVTQCSRISIYPQPPRLTSSLERLSSLTGAYWCMLVSGNS